MKAMRARWTAVSETSLMLYLGEELDVEQAPLIGKLAAFIMSNYAEVCEVTPSYTSILIQVGTPHVDLEDLAVRILQTTESGVISNSSRGKLIKLPVYYHSDVAPDLVAVARSSGLSIEELINIHTGRDYTVCAIGFAPGFAFLADVDPRIALARHAEPRAHVAAGSVGIAGGQTAVYPADSPGGWQLIGRCPTPLYCPDQQPASPFEVGDKVRFISIELEEYLERGGHV
jgi:KipI family sensor histidine kinase inhibitor